MTWFEVTVEHTSGIRGKHYVAAVFPSGAVDAERAAGFRVLAIREWNTTRFPNIARVLTEV